MDDKKVPELVNSDEYPDFWQQMQNFQQFLKDVGQGASEGNSILVSEEKRASRENLCNECSQYNKLSKRCKMCGCFMELKWRFTKSECPMSLW
jgi:hypothetical protein